MSVRATVQVTLEIESGSKWDDETTMKQVKKQAMDGANQKFAEVLKGSGIKIVGSPYCSGIIITDAE